MYLSELKIRNFRKFGQFENDRGISPSLHLYFNENLNLLVGENDSGKTAIIDAIKYVLYTRSYDYMRLSIDDFHLPTGCDQESCRATVFTIECIFRGFSDLEAKNFIEWLSIDEQGYWLRVFLTATRDGRKINGECKAGVAEGAYLDSGARDLLRATYLKPLRDAESELAPRKGSRISQILDSHDAFAEKDDHELVHIISIANTQIKEYFEEGSPDEKPGKQLHEAIDSYLEEFSDRNSPLSSRFTVADMRLKSILERLQLSVIEHIYNDTEIIIEPGLGSNNLLFIAAELLLLKKLGYTGLRLGLIEEIEAHLHPQAQLRLIEYLQSESVTSGIQLILTTHSPVLSSKLKLKNLIICKSDNVFPMGDGFTLLEKGDYRFLERFLDSTKANLFFAKGILLVEGDAENLLIPAIAEIIGYPLSKYGVSIVNVGSTAFLRYSKIYQRPSGDSIGIPVSVLTDLDIRPDEYKLVDPNAETWSDKKIENAIEEKKQLYDGPGVTTFVSPNWTLEYAIASSQKFRWLLLKAILCAQKEQNSNKYSVTVEKLIEIEKAITQFKKDVADEDLNDNEIAFRIYYSTMLTNRISKAITAQWLTEFLLVDKEKYKPLLKSDEYLGYIVEAIKHAAGE
ncbi:MAG: AAA family ATPase [Anaerolineales bacterium]|nr:AAA family ATPase [Chloroflexota bacterium]MBL6981884.1 AAA family ATPase [Anaerolineales bacterium]